MSVAASEWTPTSNMNNSTTGMKSQFLNLFIEVAIFVASELLLRPFSVRSRGTRVVSKFNLLMAQGCILSLFIALLYLCHHITYILSITTVMIFGRALWIKHVSPSSNGCPNSGGVMISKPLRIGPKTKVKGLNSVTEPYKVNSDSCHVQTAEVPMNTLQHRIPYKEVSVSAHSGISETTESVPSLRNEQVTHVKKGIQERLKKQFSTFCSSLTLYRLPLGSSTDSTSKDSEYCLAPIQTQRSTRSGYIHPSTTPPGMINTGNTCFVNSILQCLAWTPGFSNLLSSLSLDPSNNESIFLNHLKNTISFCRTLPDGVTHLSPINTNELLLSMSCSAQHLVASVKGSQRQQDAAEFLLWLLNHLHCVNQIQCSSSNEASSANVQDLKRTKKINQEMINTIGSNDIPQLEAPMMNLSMVDWDIHWQEHSSTVNDMFMGQLLEARECQNCKKVTMSSEYFTLLPLPIHDLNETSLTECISKFSFPENLVQDNMISCSCLGGSLTNGTRLALLSIVPKCLVIQLTRFSYDSSRHVAVKNNIPVRLIPEFDFFPYTMQAKFNSNPPRPTLYSLHAVCVHSGAQETSCGHYVSYCSVGDSRWYQFNDDIVTHITDIERELNTSFVLRNAYLLFYHRLD